MIVKPSPKHVAFRDDLITVFLKHGDNLSSVEMLALAAHFTGQLIALQDQRTMTPQRAMSIVANNIELGNQEVLDGISDWRGMA
jgi:hypothetical protein